MYGQFFILFGLILVGYYCNKKGYLPLETNKNVGHIVMRVTIPAMLITTIASIEITDRVLRAFLLSAAGQIAMMVVFGFLMRQYGRKRGLDSPSSCRTFPARAARSGWRRWPPPNRTATRSAMCPQGP